MRYGFLYESEVKMEKYDEEDLPIYIKSSSILIYNLVKMSVCGGLCPRLGIGIGNTKMSRY